MLRLLDWPRYLDHLPHVDLIIRASKSSSKSFNQQTAILHIRYLPVDQTLGVWPQMPYQPKNAHPIYPSTSEQHQQPQYQQPQQRQNASQAYRAQYEAHWQRPPQLPEIIAGNVANHLNKELRPLAIAFGQRDHRMSRKFDGMNETLDGIKQMLDRMNENMRYQPDDASSKVETDDIPKTDENGLQELRTTLEQIKELMMKVPQLNDRLQELNCEMAQYRKMIKKEGLNNNVPQRRRSERLLNQQSKKKKGSVRSRGK
ncbi:hypothetical protein GGI35DRAFT_465449 [Trichoderma velutinum]